MRTSRTERDENTDPNIQIGINYLRSLLGPCEAKELDNSLVAPCEAKQLDFEQHATEIRRESRARRQRAIQTYRRQARLERQRARRNSVVIEQSNVINQNRRQARSERQLRALRNTERIARQWDIDEFFK